MYQNTTAPAPRRGRQLSASAVADTEGKSHRPRRWPGEVNRVVCSNETEASKSSPVRLHVFCHQRAVYLATFLLFSGWRFIAKMPGMQTRWSEVGCLARISGSSLGVINHRATATDSFKLVFLEEQGIRPSPETDRGGTTRPAVRGSKTRHQAR